MLYPVYVHQDGAGPLGVTVPDFPGCFSSAARWDDLKRNVQEAIEVHCEGEDASIPAPSNLTDLLEDPDYRDGHWVVIDIDVAALGQEADIVTAQALASLNDFVDAVDDRAQGNGLKEIKGALAAPGVSLQGNLCWCGCGKSPTKGKFLPGHDAKAMRYLTKLHYGGRQTNLPKVVDGPYESSTVNLLHCHGYSPCNSVRRAYLIATLQQLLPGD